jgi:hypothetical protein
VPYYCVVRTFRMCDGRAVIAVIGKCGPARFLKIPYPRSPGMMFTHHTRPRYLR